jgi:hypothetical protein
VGRGEVMILNIGCGEIVNEGFVEPFVGIDNLSGIVCTKGEGIHSKLERMLKWFEVASDKRRFIVADIRHLPFKSGTFDKIFSCRFIGRYHLDRDEWDELVRVLSLEGTIEVVGIK